MARKALIEKQLKPLKFAVRYRNRCKLCGRPRGYMRMFKMCRICFRESASFGRLSGVRKASW